MARVRATITTGGEVAVTTTGKTVLQLAVAQHHVAAVKGFSVSFDGTSVTAEPINVELIRQTTAGTGGDAATPVEDSRFGVTVIATGLKDIDGSEPTGSEVIRRYLVHPQGGIVEKFNLEDEILVGGATAGRVGIKITTPAAGSNCNVVAFLSFEE